MKMDQAQFYRAQAEAERTLADKTPLPHERCRHLRSAEVWDGMAEKIERTILLKLRNERARLKKVNLAAGALRNRVSRVTRKRSV